MVSCVVDQEDTDSTTFAETLSAAVRNRGLSLERIRARLDAAGVPVSIATLSYWQSGRSLPTRSRSYHTLVELERILEVEPGHLTRHSHTSDGRRRRTLFPWESVVPGGEIASQIVKDLGIDMRGQMSRVSMQDRLVVNADRTANRQFSSLLWRAERNGLHRWPLIVEQDADVPGAVPTVASISGCEVGQVIEIPERHLIVAEMIAARPLLRGDHLLAEYQTTFARSSRPAYRLVRSGNDQVRSLALTVQFDERTLPSSISSTYQSSMEGADEGVTPVELTNNEVQVVHLDTHPGVFSLRWDWD